MNDRERRLMKSARNGRVAAYEELIQPHQKKIYNLMLKTCCNEFEASQLTQEVFVRVFSSIKHWTEDISLTLNIYKIAGEISQKAICKAKLIS